MSEKIEFCPGCNSKLTAGWIGERGRIRWYDKPRRIHTLFNQGESLLKYKGWNIRFNEQEAKRCFHCGLVLFKSEPSEKKPFSVRAIKIILVLAPFLLFIYLMPNFFLGYYLQNLLFQKWLKRWGIFQQQMDFVTFRVIMTSPTIYPLFMRTATAQQEIS